MLRGLNFRYKPMWVKPLQPICVRIVRDVPVGVFFCVTVRLSAGSLTPSRYLRLFAEH